jgi:ferric-dicitrate binding protein FerR (iron transport regulator)
MKAPDALIRRYLDGDASPEEAAALAAWLAETPEHRAHYLRAGALHRNLREWAIVRTDAPAATPAESSLFPRWLAAAAALALLGTGLWWWRMPQLQEVITITHVDGPAAWRDAAGDHRDGLRAGDRLPAGTLTVSGVSAWAELEFADGTRVLVNGDTELVFADDGRKRLHCRRGSLSADIAPQPPGRSMLVRTAAAEIEVLGTTFAVDARASLTSVSVEEGTVRVRRLADRTSADVSADEMLIVETSGPMPPLAPVAPPAPLARWQADLAAPIDGNWIGQWLPATAADPARVAAVAAPMGRQTAPDVRPVVKMAFDSPDETSLRVAVTADTRVRLRVRSSGMDRLWVFLHTDNGAGAFRGNFEVEAALADFPADAQGWRTVVLPLAAAVPVHPRFNELLGNAVRRMIVDPKSHAAEFELADLELLPGAH